ncbi:MAG: hypothetical protein AAFQ78_00215 [Bacteroidota bacterium]
MTYRIILLLNLASLLEAFIIKVLIDNEIIICNLWGIDSIYDVVALVAVKNILTLGGYQIYFWPQRNYDPKRRILLRPTALDRWIPAIPQAYWLYSPFYYAVFNLAFLCLTDFKIVVLNAWLMLMHGSFWFLYFPTGIDPTFRESVRKAPMDRWTRLMMDLVHEQDSVDNACPSMHCAFTAYLAFVLYPFYPTLAIAFPAIIAVVCLVCKQHLIVDILPGLTLGALHGSINMWMSAQ